MTEYQRRVLRKALAVLEVVVVCLAMGVLIGYFIQRQAYREGNTNLDRIQTTQVTLDDTRKVSCIIQNGYIRTCDWVHASGSDYMG